MNKLLKIVEIAWVVVALICLFEVVRLWGSGEVTLYYFMGFGAFAIVMYFVRRWQRRRYEASKAQKEQNQ